ncbi:hypothetical protein C8A01DRAFT_41674 [Parachaetomium inaequale]|uniref:Uncharacterized protein n=1 Tax=Parachaetomium inaequale TaxID=2588326 RepID=A0AAN6SLC0_9PEZI|nr:hypothetical protein C8A01DRAFT_41674 [Parachaetomium inaequale]
MDQLSARFTAMQGAWDRLRTAKDIMDLEPLQLERIGEVFAEFERFANDAATLEEQVDAERRDTSARVNELNATITSAKNEMATKDEQLGTLLQQQAILEGMMNTAETKANGAEAVRACFEAENTTLRAELDTSKQVSTELAATKRECELAQSERNGLRVQVQTLSNLQVELAVARRERDAARADLHALDGLPAELAVAKKECAIVKTERDDLRNQLELHGDLPAQLAAANMECKLVKAARDQLSHLATVPAELAIANAQNNTLTTQVQAREDDLTGARNQLAEKEAKLADTTKKYHAVNMELANATAARDGLLGQLEEAKRNTADVDGKLRTAQTDLAVANADRDALKKQLEEAQKKLTDAGERYEKVREALGATQAECASLQGQLQTTRATLVSADSRGVGLQEKLDAVNKELAGARSELELARKTSSLTASLKALNVESSNSSRIEKLTEELATVQRQLEDERVAFEEQSGTYRSTIHDLESQLQQLEPQVSRQTELEKKNKELESQLKDLKRQGQKLGLPFIKGPSRTVSVSRVKRPRVDNEDEIHPQWKEMAVAVFADIMSVRPDLQHQLPVEEAMSQILATFASQDDHQAMARRLKSLRVNATPDTWFCYEAAVVKGTWSKAGEASDPCPQHEVCLQMKRCANDYTAFRVASKK